MLLRLIYFPFFIIRSVVVDCYRKVIVPGLAPIYPWITSIFILVALLILHVYWFYKFLALIHRLIDREKERSKRRKERQQQAAEEHQDEELLRQVREEDERERDQWGAFETADSSSSDTQSPVTPPHDGDVGHTDTEAASPPEQTLSDTIEKSLASESSDAPTSNISTSNITSPPSSPVHPRTHPETIPPEQKNPQIDSSISDNPTTEPQSNYEYVATMHFTPQLLFS